MSPTKAATYLHLRDYVYQIYKKKSVLRRLLWDLLVDEYANGTEPFKKMVLIIVEY